MLRIMYPPDEDHVIFVDASKCKGCKKCELACIASHNGITPKEAIKKRKELPPRVEVIKTDTVRVPVMCRQCIEAPCAHVCPTNALLFNEQRRSILNPQLCAGCGLCQMACPYGSMGKQFFDVDHYDPSAISNPDKKMVAIRCDLCARWRICENKKHTACEEACAFGAIKRVTFDEFAELERREANGEFIPPPPKEKPTEKPKEHTKAETLVEI